MKKKSLLVTIILSLTLCLFLLPATAWAADTTAWAADAHTSHPVCGATCTHESGHTEVAEWTPLTKDMIDSASTDGYNIQSGNYYLTENIETEKGITVGELSTSNINVNICFNGYTITCSNNRENRTSQIYVNKNSSLTLCDCQGGGGFSSAAEVTRPLYWTDGTFNLYGGTLSGKGGFAYNTASSLNLYGGTLSNTTNTVHGSFTLDGASIETTSYAINAQATSTVLIKSGSVTSAGSPSVLVYTPNFTMEGGTVMNTKTTGSPYAIEFTLTGGGTISGGVIKAEYKDSSGISVGGSNPVVLSGNPTIEGPKADIRIGANGKLTVGDNLTGEYTVNYSSPNNITEAAPYSFTTADSKDNSAYFKASTVASTSGLALRNSGEVDAQTVQIYRPHLLKAYSAKEATCTEDGNEAYWQCTNTGCGKLFSDADGKTEITLADTVISATGHSYGTPTYTWNADHTVCTAERVCENDSSHKETENGTITSNTTPATCEADGKTVYTATFTNPAFETQTSEVVITKLGHDYEGVVTTQPTCTDKGVKTFTCQNDSSHTYTEDVDALGHKYDNACDATCNTCGEERTPAEHIDADENNACDVCNAELPKDGLSGGVGVIAAIVIGSMAVLSGGGFAFFWFVFRKKRREESK